MYSTALNFSSNMHFFTHPDRKTPCGNVIVETVNRTSDSNMDVMLLVIELKYQVQNGVVGRQLSRQTYEGETVEL